MGRAKSNWVAQILATLLMVMIVISTAEAENLVLPQGGTEPVTLKVTRNALDKSEPSQLLEVFVGQVASCCEGRTAIAGRYDLTGDAVSFLPAFGFEPGQTYVARTRTGQGDQLTPFQIPTATAKIAAAVTDIFPSGDALPENTLRFYLHFSVPMMPHVAFDFIKLRDDNGRVDDAAFMRFKQELWNKDRTRLTVLIDPGRIKREVATNVALGPALREGERFALTVDEGWPSADGSSVLPAFSKSFTVSAPLRSRPDTDLWRVGSPCLGTQGPLIVQFDRLFDRHLLSKDLRLLDRNGDMVAGSVDITDGEWKWQFTPSEPWRETELQLVVNPQLEDVAGNNFHDLLDHVRGEGIPDAKPALNISLKRCAG